ncbi:chemotaxis protein CheW [Pseudomonas sp. NCHU5208]|uniref:chemotaxis protein CheW n=1 Tax=unclassified Pseudomonas TaxID=196821 RepID=UPI003F9778FD
MQASSKASAGELHLQFQLGEDRYALAARMVVEVLPLRRLKQIPETPDWVAGLLAHRGQMIPVLDLSRRVLGRPALARSSTRLVLVHVAVRPGTPDAVLGLILEQATNTLRLPDEAFQPTGLEASQPDYLGPVQGKGAGLIQRIEVNGLLDAAMRALLFQAQE